MTLAEKLRAIRDVIQYDVGERGLARDPERNLINACPDDFAHACHSIANHSSASVAIVTGFYIATAQPPRGETDGPLGAVFLARAFHELGIPVVIITDGFCEKPMLVGFQTSQLEPVKSAEGVAWLPLEKSRAKLNGPIASVMTIPPIGHPWDAFLKLKWTRNIQRRKLTHLIAIERAGPAADGRCYSMRALDITRFMAPAHLLFEDAAQRQPRIESIGIGDGGNEIGMGKIPVETIERNISNGRTIACRTLTDHLIVAGISNWGAYALAAGVALVRGKKLDAALFDVERERLILSMMVKRGSLVDGKTSQRKATVDGVAFEEYIKPLVKIKQIVDD